MFDYAVINPAFKSLFDLILLESWRQAPRPAATQIGDSSRKANQKTYLGTVTAVLEWSMTYIISLHKRLASACIFTQTAVACRVLQRNRLEPLTSVPTDGFVQLLWMHGNISPTTPSLPCGEPRVCKLFPLETDCESEIWVRALSISRLVIPASARASTTHIVTFQLRGEKV